MDLSKMTFGELWKLYNQIGWEFTKRLWWLYVIIGVLLIAAYVYEHNYESINRWWHEKHGNIRDKR